MLARSTDHERTWRSYDVTPFAGTFGNQWATAGPDGTVGMISYAQATDHAEPHLYALAWRERSSCPAAPRCAGPASAFGRIHPAPAVRQEHFFQLDVSDDGAINVAFADRTPHVYFVRQKAGPNMHSRGWCGRSGQT